VIVASADPRRNVEVETARYYLPAGCAVVASTADNATLAELKTAEVVYLADGRLTARVTDNLDAIGSFERIEVRKYPGLNAYRFVR
jgi:hypothetical protein